MPPRRARRITSQTQADNDYAALSNEVAMRLNDVAHAANPAERLAIVERARRTLAEWPQNHFNYRLTEVRQMLSMLDEAIVELRAARTATRFDLTLSAYVDPPTNAEPLLPCRRRRRSPWNSSSRPRTRSMRRPSARRCWPPQWRRSSATRRHCRTSGRKRPEPKRLTAIQTRAAPRPFVSVADGPDDGARQSTCTQRRRHWSRPPAARDSSTRCRTRGEAARGGRGPGRGGPRRVWMPHVSCNWRAIAGALRAPEIQRYGIANRHADGFVCAAQAVA